MNFSIHRAAGVLLGQACGDALGVPYEFTSGPRDGPPAMIGGGLGPYAPGEWSDDTQMATCIAEVAATGADLTSEDAQDAVAERFLEWQHHGASDIGNQTSSVLTAARQASGPVGARLRKAASAHLRAHPNSAGNGALMRTSVVGLTRVDDPDATAAAAAALAALTHPAQDAIDSCVLWSEAVRRAVTTGELNVVDGLELLDVGRRDLWRQRIADAEARRLSDFAQNGWTVTALQAAWGAIRQTPLPVEEPEASSFACLHLQHALERAIGIGHDTDTVAAIAGGLLGAYWGVSALPARWRRVVHGWPGLRSRDLVSLAIRTFRQGAVAASEWPLGDRVAYEPGHHPYVPHPADSGVLLGTVAHLGSAGDAAVSLCRLGVTEVPAAGMLVEDHVEFWLVDSDDPAANPHLDFVLCDLADTVVDLRAEGRTVLLHCVAAEQRTPSAGVAYARRLGVPADEAEDSVRFALPSARGYGNLWRHARRVAPSSRGELAG